MDQEKKNNKSRSVPEDGVKLDVFLGCVSCGGLLQKDSLMTFKDWSIFVPMHYGSSGQRFMWMERLFCRNGLCF